MTQKGKTASVKEDVKHYDVAVIGAGGGGTYCTALQKHRGRRVATFDRQEPLSATIGIAARVHMGLEYLTDRHTKLCCLIASCIMALMWWNRKTNLQDVRGLRDMCVPGSTAFAVTQNTSTRREHPFTVQDAEASYEEVRQEYKEIFSLVKHYLEKESGLHGQELELLTAKILFGRPAMPGEEPEQAASAYGDLAHFYRRLTQQELAEWNKFSRKKSKDPLIGGLHTQELGLDLMNYLSALYKSLDYMPEGHPGHKPDLYRHSEVTRIEPLLAVRLTDGSRCTLQAGDYVDGRKIKAISWEQNHFTLLLDNGKKRALKKGDMLEGGQAIASMENKFLVYFQREYHKLIRKDNLLPRSGHVPQANCLAKGITVRNITKRGKPGQKVHALLCTDGTDGTELVEGGDPVQGISIKSVSEVRGQFDIRYTVEHVVSADQVVNAAWEKGIDLPSESIKGNRPAIEAKAQRMARIEHHGATLPPTVFILDPKGTHAMMWAYDGKNSGLIYEPGPGYAHPPYENSTKQHEKSTKKRWLDRAIDQVPAFSQIHPEEITFLDRSVLMETGKGRHERKLLAPREGMPGYFEIFPLKAVYAPLEGIWLDGMLEARAGLRLADQAEAPLPPEVLPGEGERLLQHAKNVLLDVLRGGCEMPKISGIAGETPADVERRKTVFQKVRHGNDFPEVLLEQQGKGPGWVR